MKKRTAKRAVVIIAVVAVAVTVAVVLYNREQQRLHARHDRLSKEEVAMLQPGDIILRQGFGVVSGSIAATLGEEFSVSHCGIVDVDSNGNAVVYHSVSASLSDFDGMQTATIDEFGRESLENTIMVVRFRHNGEKPLSDLAKAARKYYEQKVPFDNIFDMSDHSKMYCSEMVWSAMKEAYGYDIYPDKSRTEVVKFSPFFDTNNFQRIINHQK